MPTADNFEYATFPSTELFESNRRQFYALIYFILVLSNPKHCHLNTSKIFIYSNILLAYTYICSDLFIEYTQVRVVKPQTRTYEHECSLFFVC